MRHSLQQLRVEPAITFGVELELCFPAGTSRAEVQDTVNHAAGRTDWKLVSDDSIRCSLQCSSVEVNTPVLQGTEGLHELLRVCDAINDLEPMVNSTTGLHVHVAYGRDSQWELHHLKQLVYNWLCHEEALDLLVPAARRASNNSYAQSLKFKDDDVSSHLCWAELAGLHGIQGLDMIAGLAEKGAFHGPAAAAARAALHSVEDADQLTDMVCPLGHNYKLNLQALTKHGTVEFRHPAGTWNGAEVAHYVMLYAGFVHTSKLKYVRDWTAAEQGDPLLYLANSMYDNDKPLQQWMSQQAHALKPPAPASNATSAARSSPSSTQLAKRRGEEQGVAGTCRGSEGAALRPAALSWAGL